MPSVIRSKPLRPCGGAAKQNGVFLCNAQNTNTNLRLELGPSVSLPDCKLCASLHLAGLEPRFAVRVHGPSGPNGVTLVRLCSSVMPPHCATVRRFSSSPVRPHWPEVGLRSCPRLARTKWIGSQRLDIFSITADLPRICKVGCEKLSPPVAVLTLLLFCRVVCRRSQASERGKT